MKVAKPRRAVVLSDLVFEHGWEDGVEVGVFKGQTLGYVLAHNPELAMVGVDTWAAGDPALDPPQDARRTSRDTGYRSYADEDMQAVFAQACGVASMYPGRCTLIRAPSVVAARDFPVWSVDFVFIDGDHTEQGVRDDIRMWFPAIRRTGWLLGHDSGYPSVRRAIDDLVPGWRPFNADIWGLPVSEIDPERWLRG